MKQLTISIIIFLLLIIFNPSISSVASGNYSDNSNVSVKIAPLKDNKKAALTMCFDDSSEGQATIGVPSLIRRNMIGTWYVNPGNEAYKKYADIWKKIAPEAGQELANHTYTHTPAYSKEEVVYEVGEAAKAIWRIRGDEDYGSLISYCTGGGIIPDQALLNEVLADFKCVDRQTNPGIKVYGKTVAGGWNADQMFEMIPNVISEGRWFRLTFHEICPTTDDPVKVCGKWAVKESEFEEFLDKLEEVTDSLWIGGGIQVYKYVKEMNSGKAQIISSTIDTIIVKLTIDLDPFYYDEPLTLIVDGFPDNWESCTKLQSGQKNQINISGGVAIFDAIPEENDIILIRDKR